MSDTITLPASLILEVALSPKDIETVQRYIFAAEALRAALDAAEAERDRLRDDHTELALELVRLQREVSRLQEAIDKADGALIRWGKHEDGCGYSWPHHIQWADCTCGLRAANDALRALAPPVPQEADETRESCPGSGQPLLNPGHLFGTCSVCGRSLVVHDEGSDIAWPHDPATPPRPQENR